MRGIVWIAVVGLSSAGCFETPQEVLDDIACSDICACIPEILSCDAQCHVVFAPVSDPCFEFVTTNATSCARLRADLDDFCMPAPDPQEDTP